MRVEYYFFYMLEHLNDNNLHCSNWFWCESLCFDLIFVSSLIQYSLIDQPANQLVFCLNWKKKIVNKFIGSNIEQSEHFYSFSHLNSTHSTVQSKGKFNFFDIFCSVLPVSNDKTQSQRRFFRFICAMQFQTLKMKN